MPGLLSRVRLHEQVAPAMAAHVTMAGDVALLQDVD